MARKALPPEIRQMNITATQLLASVIRRCSKMPPHKLEESLGIGGEGHGEAKSGMQWRRYQRGERTMCPEQRDRVARKALLRGWLPADRPPLFGDERVAWGSLQRLLERHMSGEEITPAIVAADQVQWRAWHRARRQMMGRERKSLLRLTLRLAEDATALMTFLGRIDGAGHDYWTVDLPEREVEDEIGNIETIDGATDMLAKLDEVRKLVQIIELKVLHEFAAEMIPPRVGGASMPA